MSSATVITDSERAAEVARQWPGWHVWVAGKGSPVATRTGNQRPPANDGTWAQTIMADNWAELERELAGQAANDAARA
jgi:hypothetical protein